MSRTFPLILIALGAWLGAYLPLTDSSYLDLAHGRQVAETGRLAPPDALLPSSGLGDTSGWLGSWVLFFVHRIGGERGLQLLGAVCLAAGALLLYLVRPSGAGFVVAAASVSLAGSSLDLSTAAFSWLLVASMIYCWSMLRLKNTWWLFLLLPPLAAWPLLNREFLVGFALAGLALGSSLVRAVLVVRRGELKQERLAVFQEALILCAVGAAAVMFAFLTLPGQPFENPLRDAWLLGEAGAHAWQPVSLERDALYFFLATVSGLLAVSAPPLVLPFETLACAVFLFLSLFSRHFVMYFAAVAVPPTGRALAMLGEVWTSSSRNIFGVVGGRWVALAAGVALVLPTALVSPQPHPFEGAMRYLSDQVLQRRLFNVPQVGGLTSWSLGPDRLPFAYLRPASIEAFQRETTENRLDRIFENYDLQLALLGRDFANQRAEELAQLEEARLLYFDEAALLYALSDESIEPPGVPTLDYFDPLTPPSEYTAEEVPLAIDELLLYFDRYPPDATTLWQLGKLLLRAEEREEALEAFEAAHRLDPDDLPTLRELSRLYLEKGMYGLAERSTRRALTLTRDEELVYNLALSLYGRARYAEAAQEFEAVLELNQGNLKARRALVDLYRQLGELEQSYLQKQTLDAMIESRTSALLDEARERHESLDFAAEADLYAQAIEVSGDDPELYWNLAMALLTDERKAEAMNVLRTLLGVAPRHAEARLTLGVLCLEEPTCPPDEARSHLEVFLELAPEDLNAELARQRLESLEDPE